MARIDAPTFLLHWSLALLLLISLSTGLRIASDYAQSGAGIAARRILWLLPEGQVIESHVVSGWLVTFVAIAYAVFVWRGRLTSRVRLRRRDLRALDPTRAVGAIPSDRAWWSSISRLLYQFAFGGITLMAVTGWMMYNEAYLGLGQFWVTMIHGLTAWSLVAYVVLHVLAVTKVGAFWKMLRPRTRHATVGFTAIVGAAVLVGGTYKFRGAGHTELRVIRVDAPPELRGDGTDPVWQVAPSVEVHTARGVNLPRGESTVEIRAVHDGDFIYFRFRWSDPQRSSKMTPLVKGAEGWRVLQSQLERNDENEYYEDKFAVIFSRQPALASGTTHLGQDLVRGSHYRNPRGLHFTEDGSIVDLWHWKSVRSGGATPGYVDDNYIGPLQPPAPPGARYTGGYTQDPTGTAHPYVQNWVKVDPEAPLASTRVLPLYLPARRELLERMGPIDLDPHASDRGPWFLTKDEVVPYDPTLDDFPVGTVLPGIVIEGTFVADRADVRGEAAWADGHWTLEAKRVLDTGSDFDVAFLRGEEIFVWVSVFNHTQTRHSQHLHPVRMILE